MNKLACILVLLFGLQCSWAQECNFTYSGIILDEHDNSAVGSARIFLKENNQTYAADVTGKFTIENLCEGTYNLLFFHHYGCEPVKKEIVIKNSFSDTIYLEYHYDDELDQVLVVGNSYARSPQVKVKVSALEIQLEKGKNFMEALKSIPGVTSLSTGSTVQKPVIHGMYGNRVLITVDDIRLEGQQWGTEHAPEINSFAYDQIEVIKGASTIAYGSDAVAGVIRTKKSLIPLDQKFGGVFDAGYGTNGNQFFGNLKLNGRFKNNKWSWMTQGSYKKVGTLKTPRYYLANSGMDEVNALASLNYEGEKLKSSLTYTYFQTNVGILAAAHISNVTDLLNAFQAETPAVTGGFMYQINSPRLLTQHHLAVWEASYKLKNDASLNLAYSYQLNDRKEFDDHSGSDDAKLNLSLATQTINASYDHRWLPNLDGKIGVNYWHQTNLYQGRYFVPNYYKNAAGIFWIEKYAISEKHHLEAGARFDFLNYETYLLENHQTVNYKHNYNRFSGSLSYLFEVNHHLSFRASVGNSWRAPSINELYSDGIHHGSAIFEKGDRNLGIEKAVYGSVSANYSSNRWSTQIELYHYEFGNYLYLQATGNPVLTIHGAYPGFAYRQVKAAYSGLDVAIKYKFSNWLTLSVNGSLVRAFDRERKEHLVNIPADRIRPSLIFTKNFKNEHSLTIRMGITAVRKQTKAPVEYDYVAAPNGYVLIDAVVMYGIPSAKGMVNFIVTGDNLLNKEYRDYMNRFRYYANEMGRAIYLKIQIPF